MSRSTSYVLALALVVLGAVAILLLQDPAMRLFASEQAALYVALLGGLIVLAGIVLAAFTAAASMRRSG
jgi:hypothetical protein